MAAPPPALLKGKSFKGPIKWNEENLEENEKIKAELPQGPKITEPKTPYHPPLEGDLAAVDPLQLDGVPAGASHDHFDVARKRHYAKEALALSRKQIEEELAQDDAQGSK